MIYSLSNFFINQLKESYHFYIDGTFIVPAEFTQVLIILYYNHKLNKKFPGCYIIINNKSEIGYINAFNDFKNILTNKNNDEILIKTYTTDFESALINALTLVFGNKIRCVGCLFHYGQALIRAFRNKKVYILKK